MVRSIIAFKFWFFRHYWWVLAVLLTAIELALYKAGFSLVKRGNLMLIGIFLSGFYFVQKQRLEEMKLFREIFQECNARYNELNEYLNAIVDSNAELPLTDKERAVLNDYFNLCGEEYLYYRQGYILPSVWDEWRQGMEYFLEKPRIRPIWQKERQGKDAYYDLPYTFD